MARTLIKKSDFFSFFFFNDELKNKIEKLEMSEMARTLIFTSNIY